VIAFLIGTEQLFAQQQGFVNLAFSVANPQGEFRQKLDSLGTPAVGYGFGFQGGWMPEKLPIAIGIHADFIFMGSQERTFRSGTGGMFRDTVSTQTTFIPITGFVRLQPNLLGYVFPYAEGFFGWNVINSSSTIRTNVQFNGPRPEGESFSSGPFIYGYGAGVMIKFLDIVAGDNDVTSLLLDVKMRYTKGATTSYRIIQEIDNNGFVRYSEASSATDLVNFSAGLSVRF
jgi:hypothetical protein